jgi:hypothetical protein
MKVMRIVSATTLALLATTGLSGLPASHRAEAETWAGKTITLAGRKVQCKNVDILLDNELPSEGGAADDVLVLNPQMLQRQPKTVRLFVFNHECGHLTVGDSELKADCYGVHQGVKQGWLDHKGLQQVCDSFEGAPETDTHPSAKRRCANLEQCFAAATAEKTSTATASLAKPQVPPPAAPATTASTGSAKGTVSPVKADPASRKLSAWRCSDPITIDGTGKDPIGELISKEDEHIKHCR